MTRFEKEISGSLGEFWKDHAEKELKDLRRDLDVGDITIDENGVARNKLGRAVMSDLLEKLTYITKDVDVEATKAARDEEVSEIFDEYKRNYGGPSAEDLFEMRAAFGEGTTVVNVITGERINF